MQNNSKIAFWGNGPYALIALQELIKYDSPINLVVTTGKDHSVTNFAKEKGIQVLKYNLKDLGILSKQLQNINVCIVASFGKIIPKEILSIPKHGFLNIHPSLLPRHRGPAPVVSEILSRDKKGGVTIIKLDKEMDHGPILGQIGDVSKGNKYATAIYKQRFKLGVQQLIDLLPDYLQGQAPLKEQDHSKATYSKMIRKEDGLLDLKNKEYSPVQVHQMILAYTPWPGVYMKWQKNKKEYLIYFVEAQIIENAIISKDYKETFFVQDKKLYLNLVDKSNQTLEVTKLKIAGKNEMKAEDFINGYLR